MFALFMSCCYFKNIQFQDGIHILSIYLPTLFFQPSFPTFHNLNWGTCRKYSIQFCDEICILSFNPTFPTFRKLNWGTCRKYAIQIHDGIRILSFNPTFPTFHNLNWGTCRKYPCLLRWHYPNVTHWQENKNISSCDIFNTNYIMCTNVEIFTHKKNFFQRK